MVFLEFGYEKRGVNVCGEFVVIDIMVCGKYFLVEERIVGKYLGKIVRILFLVNEKLK